MVAWRSALATTRTGRGTRQPALLDVPARLGQDVVARRRQRHRIGPLAAGHEAEGGVGGQAQELFQPGPGDVLDHGRPRGGDGVESRLVPPAGQHVRRRGRLEGAPDHEPEVAGTGGTHQGGLDGTG